MAPSSGGGGGSAAWRAAGFLCANPARRPCVPVERDGVRIFLRRKCYRLFAQEEAPRRTASQSSQTASHESRLRVLSAPGAAIGQALCTMGRSARSARLGQCQDDGQADIIT